MDEDIDRKMLYGCLELLVLAVLARGSRHGYGIRHDLADRTGFYFHPAFGRLYPLLADMERRKLVVSRPEQTGPSRVIRVYSLTAAGRKELALRQGKWQHFATCMGRALRVSR